MPRSGEKRKASNRPKDDDTDSLTDPADEPPTQRFRLEDDGEGAPASAGAGAQAEREEDYITDEDAVDESDVDESIRAGDRKKPTRDASDDRMPLTVKRVRMKNLRCHKNLEVEFEPRVNFIIGRNGSGKSSVLTAIKLALGMPLPSAASAKRGAIAASDSIIRDKSDGETVVEVEFTNEGSVGMLDPALYGKFFLVRRTLTRTESGKVSDKLEIFREGKDKVPVGKKEFEAHLQSANVFYKNPVMIMDQETSKQFFAGSAKDQYNFFMEATLLKRNFIAVAETVETVKKMEQSLTQHRGVVKDAEGRRDAAASALKAVQRVSDLSDRLKSADVDCLFAELNSDKVRMDAKASQIEKDYDPAKVHDAQLRLDQAVLKAEHEKDAAEKEAGELASRMSKIQEAMEEKTKTVQAHAQTLAQAKRKEGEATKRVDAAKRQVKTCERDLQDFEDALSMKDVGSERAKRLQRITAAQAALQRAETDYAAAQTAANNIPDSRALQREQHELERGVQGARDRIDELRYRLDSMKKAASEATHDPISRLRAMAKGRSASQYSQILKDYETIQGMIAAKEFNDPPVGPLFAHIKCDPKWSKAFESVFRRQLGAFLVSNPRDAAVLERKFGRGRGMQYILKARPTPDMLRKYEDRREYRQLRLMDVVEIDDDWVRTAVHDDIQYNRVLLADSYEAAVRLATEVKSMKYVLRADGGRETWSETGATSRAADSGDYLFPPLMGPLSTAAEADKGLTQVDDITADIREVEGEKREMEARLRDVQKRVMEASAASQAVERKLAAAKNAVAACRNKLEAAENEPEPQDTNEEDELRLATLQGKVASAREGLVEAEEAVAEAAAEVAALKPQMDAVRTELEEMKKGLATDALTAAEQKVREMTRRLEAAIHAKENLSRKVKEMQEKGESERQRLNAELEEWERKLALLQARTQRQSASDPSITLTDAKARAAAIRKDLEKESKRVNQDINAVADIKQRYEVANNAYEAMRAAAKEVEDNFRKLVSERAAHIKQYKASKQAMCDTVTKTFKRLMARKGYAARLVFNHDDEILDVGTLEIFVTPDKKTRFSSANAGFSQIDAENAPLQHVGTLSGGEKSSSTLILLAAIAKCSPVPFRIIDEFDVFQDEISRKLSLKFLLEQGTSPEMAHFDGRFPQMILLTPHDISSGVDVKTVKVLKLKEPERTSTGGS